jgi:hypothetical protein
MHEHQLHQREKKQRGGNDWRERLQRTNIRNRNTETRPTKTKHRNKKNTGRRRERRRGGEHRGFVISKTRDEEEEKECRQEFVLKGRIRNENSSRGKERNVARSEH